MRNLRKKMKIKRTTNRRSKRKRRMRTRKSRKMVKKRRTVMRKRKTGTRKRRTGTRMRRKKLNPRNMIQMSLKEVSVKLLKISPRQSWKSTKKEI